jgi:hypothetical protein
MVKAELLKRIHGEVKILVAGEAAHHQKRRRRSDATRAAGSRIEAAQIEPKAAHRSHVNGTEPGPSLVEGGVLRVFRHRVISQPGESPLNRGIGHRTAAERLEEAAVSDRDARDTELPTGESAKNECGRCVQVKQDGPFPPHHIRERQVGMENGGGPSTPEPRQLVGSVEALERAQICRRSNGFEAIGTQTRSQRLHEVVKGHAYAGKEQDPPRRRVEDDCHLQPTVLSKHPRGVAEQSAGARNPATLR